MVWLLDYVANTLLRPWIVTQPASQTATVGDHVSFTVAADGSAPLSYQWRKDGVPIAGNASALSSTLMLASVLTADAGAYDCVVLNEAGFATSSSAALTVQKAVGVVTLFDLHQIYDGAPRAVSFTTSPVGLTVDVTYNGSATPPTAPGSYAVIATIDDANYTGSASGTLIVATTVLVRHAPALNGALNGSVQVLLPESTTLNGGAAVSGDLLMPGTPAVRLNGRPIYAGTIDGTGAP
jgi:rhamnogalacturonan endolyase